MKRLLLEIYEAYIAPRIMTFVRDQWQLENLWRFAPWIVGLALIGWGMNYFDLTPDDLFHPVKAEVQKFSNDATALMNGEAVARIQKEMRSAKIEIEMPQTTDQDKDSKIMAQELHAARLDMLEQRRQELDKRLQNSISKDKK